jgi:hypothetical protein
MMGSRNLVENNLIHCLCWNGSLTYTAIRCGPGSDKKQEKEGHTIVRRNTVFNCGNAIVSIGGMPNSVVEYNHIHDGGRACKDVSLLYTQLPVIEPTVFRYNWVHGCRSPQIALGIRGDDQTRGLTVHHNVVWDCGWAGIVVKGDRNGVHNNTVLGSGKSDFDMDWNLYFNPNLKLDQVKFSGQPFAAWRKRGKDVHSLYADPLFVNADKYDFRLKPDSPALKLGFEPIDMSTVGPRGKVGFGGGTAK